MNTIKVVFTILLTLCAPTAAMAQDAGLSGNWKIISKVDGKTRQSDCTFANTGASFTGQCKRDDGTTALKGQVDKMGIHMTGKSSYAGFPIDLIYEATFADPKAAKGTIEVHPFGVHGDFTMTRP